jgi:uncharacterized ferredoxin-like protein
MPWSLDARIPLMTVPDRAALAAELVRGGPAAVLTAGPPLERQADAVALVGFDPSGAAHAAACGCCGGRSAAAIALDRLFQDRVRGTCRWFDRVVALAETPAARAEIAAALCSDAVTQARFKAA